MEEDYFYFVKKKPLSLRFLIYIVVLVQVRCEVMKHGTEQLEYSRVLHKPPNLCKTCSHQSADSFCTTCFPPNLICELCRLPVNGLCCLCSVCGHGGHATHWIQWFKVKEVCPTGCGCPCQQFMQYQLGKYPQIYCQLNK